MKKIRIMKKTRNTTQIHTQSSEHESLQHVAICFYRKLLFFALIFFVDILALVDELDANQHAGKLFGCFSCALDHDFVFGVPDIDKRYGHSWGSGKQQAPLLCVLVVFKRRN